MNFEFMVRYTRLRGALTTNGILLNPFVITNDRYASLCYAKQKFDIASYQKHIALTVRGECFAQQNVSNHERIIKHITM